MRRFTLKMSVVGCVALSLGLLSACQSTPQTQSALSPQSLMAQPLRDNAFARPPVLITAPSAKINIEPQPESLQTEQPLARVTLEITMPQAPQGGFTTQALAVNQIAKLKLELVGPGIAAARYADGADANGFITNAGGTFSVSFSNVPYGAARRLSLRAYDNTETEIPGATIKTAFAVGAATTNIELSFRTTPLADILATITGSQANQYLAENLNLATLQSFVDTLTGRTGLAPNYTYTTHPTLIDGAVIGADLIGNQGNIGALNASKPEYKITPGDVSFTLTGLINPDTATVVIRDPASGDVAGRTNGAGTLSGVRPGTWKVEATAPGYTANTSPTVLVTSGNTANAGTISFAVASSPAITALSSSSGVIGSSLTITGTHFHNSIAGNTVDFGGTVATITSASPTQLVVTVPSGLSGTQNVRVSVGGNNSNTQSFAVTPVISSLSVDSGIVGSTVTLTGTGFSTTEANNTVRLNGVNAPIISASATTLIVTVPQMANGNFTVQVGTQTSTGVAFNVLPTISLTAPTADATLTGTVPLSVSTTSGNAISKVEYFSGATKLGESTSAPYGFDWDTTTAVSGAHSLSAKITDAQSNEATSTAVNVTVNQAPVISALTASLNPVPGLAHTTQLNCNASDSEGTPTLTWSTVGGDFGSFSATTGSQVYWTAPNTLGGPYTIRCSASDGIHTITQDLPLTVVDGEGEVTGSGGLF